MKRHERCRRFLKRVVIISVILAILIGVIGYLQDMNMKVDLLAKRTYKQETRIEQLEKENVRLQKIVVSQQKQIQVKLNNKPVKATVVHKKEGFEFHEVIDPVGIVVVTLVSVGKAITSFLPSATR